MKKNNVSFILVIDLPKEKVINYHCDNDILVSEKVPRDL